MKIGEDDPTPARSDAYTALWNAGIELSTAASRLIAAAELVDAAARRCSEAARLVDAYEGPNREALLADLERELENLDVIVHETRRAMRTARYRMRGETPP